MDEFTKVDLSGQVPEEICISCAKKGVLYGPTQTVLVHCNHGTPCGAYRVLDRPWKVVVDIDVVGFREMVVRGLTKGELRADLERDLLRILSEMGKGEVKH
jgi:hypothetical protein